MSPRGIYCFEIPVFRISVNDIVKSREILCCFVKTGCCVVRILCIDVRLMGHSENWSLCRENSVY